VSIEDILWHWPDSNPDAFACAAAIMSISMMDGRGGFLAYVDKNMRVVDEQIQKAGVRLAATLNAALSVR